MKVEKVLVQACCYFPDLNLRVNLNILICAHVCYISAQVADFMSSVGNRLIGGKSTVAVENFIAIGRPTMLLVAWHYRFSSCYVFRVFGVSVRAQLKAESRKLTKLTNLQIYKFNYQDIIIRKFPSKKARYNGNPAL